MSKVKIYLGGSMSEKLKQGRFDEAVRWRQSAKDLLIDNGIDVFDPTSGFEVNKNFEPCGIPMQNLTYVKKCDLLLVNLEYILKSPGTLFEMTSFYVLQKPIVAYGSLTNCSHIDDIITMYMGCLDDCLKYIVSMYGQ